MALWKESVGRKGLDLVTVYERVAGGPLQIEWWTPTRVQQSLTTLTGKPVYDRNLALRVARKISQRIADGAEGRTAREVLGMKQQRTLGELIREYHAKRSEKWSARHKADQEQHRDFWLAVFGAERALPLSPAECEAAVDLEAKAKEWSDRSRQKPLVYLKAVMAFAEKKLKWIGPDENLSNLEIPQPDQNNAELTYSARETARLLPALEDVDLRTGALGEIAYITGRRQTAIRTLARDRYLPAFEIELDNGETVVASVIDFPAATDKARKRSRVVLSARAADLLNRVAERWPDSQWLIPSDDGLSPLPERTLYDLLYAAERRAKVPHVDGRGLHGLKRRSVTAFGKATGSLRAARGQSGTTEATLKGIYDQQDLEEQLTAVRALETKRNRDSNRDTDAADAR